MTELNELRERIAGLEAELAGCKADCLRLEAELDRWIQRAAEFKSNVSAAYNSVAAAQRLRDQELKP